MTLLLEVDFVELDATVTHPDQPFQLRTQSLIEHGDLEAHLEQASCLGASAAAGDEDVQVNINTSCRIEQEAVGVELEEAAQDVSVLEEVHQLTTASVFSELCEDEGGEMS